MTELPLVTVNILAHDRKAELARSLRTLLEDLDYPPDRLELIVVDNHSTDGTREMVRRDFPGVRLIENENVGAAGWTRGFEAGSGDYFLILDDDCYLSGDSLRRAVEAAVAREADLVSFRVVSGEDPGYEFNSHYRTGLLSFWASAALMSRRAVERLGGFDPNIFIWANELEFTIRLLDQGFRHVYLPEVAAVHMKPPPAGHSPVAYRIHMRHLAYVVAKLLRPGDAAMVLASVLAKMVLGLARAPSRWRAVPAFVSGVRMGIGARRPVRPEVSRLYRKNFRDFSSPLFYLAHPARSLQSRHDDFYASRPELYPSGTGSLMV